MRSIHLALLIGSLVIPAGSCLGDGTSSAAIVDSGSTNRAGYSITVDHSGSGTYVLMPRAAVAQRGVQTEARTRIIPGDLVRRFYADLSAAEPFSSLPDRHCVKSVSFGSVLRIEFDGKRTPDLSCGDAGDAKLKALIQDATEITKIMTAP